jgi:hypothetical protein
LNTGISAAQTLRALEAELALEVGVSTLLEEESTSEAYAEVSLMSSVSAVLTWSLASSGVGDGERSGESPSDNNWRENFLPRHVWHETEFQQSQEAVASTLDNSLVERPRISQEPKQLPFKFISPRPGLEQTTPAITTELDAGPTSTVSVLGRRCAGH